MTHPGQRAHDKRHALNALRQVSTLILDGDRDAITPPSHSHRIAAALVTSGSTPFSPRYESKRRGPKNANRHGSLKTPQTHPTTKNHRSDGPHSNRRNR